MPNRILPVCALVLGLASTAAYPGGEPAAEAPRSEAAGGLAGRVSAKDTPLGAVGVYAYQLTDLSLHKVFTDRDGKFSFATLPAGLYKIVAFKRGFVPAVVLLTRATSSAYQFLDFELAEERVGTEGEEGDFWAIRGRIPSDVLREIPLADTAPEAEPETASAFNTELQALAGRSDHPELGDAYLTGAAVGIEGRFAGLDLGLRTRFRDMDPSGSGSAASSGEGTSRALSLSLRHRDRARIDLTTQEGRLAASGTAPVDLERYGLSWSHSLGQTGESSFKADYVSERNFYRGGGLEPLALPAASRTLRLEGSYGARLNRHSSFQTGVSFRQRQLPPFGTRGSGRVAGIEALAGRDQTRLEQERIDLFGLADWSVQPAVMLEYGLFTTLYDGSVSFSPHGGLVLDLSPRWVAETFVRQRLVEDEELDARQDFVPIYYGQRADCGSAGEEHCYHLSFTRQLSADEELSFGALHREFSDTLRLYFDEDFFSQLESLFLVQGDELPELKFAIRRRLGDKVRARLESNIGAGGGGVFRAGDDATYRNAVSYLATSLNTEFESTRTGLFLAFHRVRQELTPIDRPGMVASEMELDSLQILLTQDLDAFLDLATDWAILLDMQLSRGTTPYDQLSDRELRRQVIGGLAFKF